MKNPGTRAPSGPLPHLGNAKLKMICSKRINKVTQLLQLVLPRKAVQYSLLSLWKSTTIFNISYSQKCPNVNLPFKNRGREQRTRTRLQVQIRFPFLISSHTLFLHIPHHSLQPYTYMCTDLLIVSASLTVYGPVLQGQGRCLFTFAFTQ